MMLLITLLVVLIVYAVGMIASLIKVTAPEKSFQPVVIRDKTTPGCLRK
jgi:hypothetical protein